MALLFGSTWLVNSAVFFTVLVLILLANLECSRHDQSICSGTNLSACWCSWRPACWLAAGSVPECADAVALCRTLQRT